MSIVYRTIRDDENPANGLGAKNPNANYKVSGHIQNQSRQNLRTQYISTTRWFGEAEKYALQDECRMVEIDLDIVEDEGCEVIDVSTKQRARDVMVTAKGTYPFRAVNFAANTEEVLIVGYVPCEAIERMHEYIDGVRVTTEFSWGDDDDDEDEDDDDGDEGEDEDEDEDDSDDDDDDSYDGARCVTCNDPVTVPRTYKGTSFKCRGCR